MSTIPDNPFFIQTEVFPEDPKEFLIRISQIYQDISQKGNLREISDYRLNEIPTGRLYPGQQAGPPITLNPRNGYRKQITISALVLGVNNFAHGIAYPAPNTIRFMDIYGVIENLATPQYEPIPNDDIHLRVLGANVEITIPAAYVGFTGRVILEYTKTD